jgi:hypothetical protein
MVVVEMNGPKRRSEKKKKQKKTNRPLVFLNKMLMTDGDGRCRGVWCTMAGRGVRSWRRSGRRVSRRRRGNKWNGMR